jgi:hypothetical protein
MKSRVLKIVLTAAATVLTAAAITLPNAAPALAATAIGEIDLGYQGSGNTLYADAHGSYIETTALGSELQRWATTNGQRWTNNFGTIVPVAEIELMTAQGLPTGQCVNLGADHTWFYLDSCQHGDNNELFWFRQYGSNNQLYNLVNVEASMLNKEHHINSLGYMTGLCFGCDYSRVENLTAGAGVFGLWWTQTVPVT